MDCQVEMTYRGAVYKSAGDHDPACQCLGDEEHAHYEVNAKILKGNFFCEKEIENRNGIHQPGEAGDEPVDPFNVKDIFVFLQGHIEIDLLEFRRALVFNILFKPGLFPNGWKRPT